MEQEGQVLVILHIAAFLGRMAKTSDKVGLLFVVQNQLSCLTLWLQIFTGEINNATNIINLWKVSKNTSIELN